MRLKNRTRKAPESPRLPASDAELEVLAIVEDLTRALRNTRRYLAGTKANINFEGLDAAIARGEAALKKHG